MPVSLAFRAALAELAGQRARRRKVPAGKLPKRAQLEYQRLLTDMRRTFAELVKDEIIDVLPDLLAQASEDRGGIRQDAAIDDILRIFSNFPILFASAHPEAQIETVLGDVAGSVQATTADNFRRQTKAGLGLEVIVPAPPLQASVDAFVKSNLDLVKSLFGGQLDRMKTIVATGVQGGQRVEVIRDQLVHQLGITQSRAALIARDQTLKLNGEMAEIRQRDAGIEEYVWDTSQDERVRGRPGGKYPNAHPSHWALHGKICRWDDPTVYREQGSSEWLPRSAIGAVEMHPGADYQDRCVAIPYFEGFSE